MTGGGEGRRPAPGTINRLRDLLARHRPGDDGRCVQGHRLGRDGWCAMGRETRLELRRRGVDPSTVIESSVAADADLYAPP